MEKKIEDLTPEQEKRMDQLAEAAINEVHSGKTDYDGDAILDVVEFMYGDEKGEKKEIPITICSSPEDMYLAAAEFGYKKDKGETFDYLGMGYDRGWTAFYEFMEEIGVDFSDIPEWKIWKKINESGIWATLLFENMAFVCIRPSSVKVNADGNLHCSDGMAIQWIDGTGYFYLNGVEMEEKHVMCTPESLDVKEIVNEKNVEVRRELIRKIGMERFIQKAGAKVLDKQGDYELLSVRLSDEVPDARYLKMLNPSIGVWHVEGVEGNTVEEAINWRAGDIAKKWAPSVLT